MTWPLPGTFPSRWEKDLGATLFELEALRLPVGPVAAGAAPRLVVGAQPPHPANRVEAQVRQEGRPLRSVWLAPGAPSYRGADPADARRQGLLPSLFQCFSGSLPPFEAARDLEYRFLLWRAGQQLGAFPADGSWLSVVAPANPQVANRPAPAGQPSRPAAPDEPRWAYELEFFAALTVDLRAEVLGATPEGYRINFYVKDGTIKGPLIDAAVLPEGGDWMCIRPDGIGMVDISITYQTASGALILERAGGVFDLGPDGYAKVAAGDFTGAPPFYATPSWETAHPDWSWLNRRQGFGVGRVVLEQLQVRCDIYLPVVGGPIVSAPLSRA